MHPVLFEIFGIAISPYGVLLAVGLLVSVAVALWRAGQVNVQSETIMDVAFFGILAGFLGGRIGFILTHLDAFVRDPVPILLDRAGFQFLGGLILGSLAAIWVVRRRRESFPLVGDVVTPSLALGHAFGRMGCFFAGCCYGEVCPASARGIAVVFPPHSPAAYDQFMEGRLPGPDYSSLPVWPTQLMEASGNLILFAILMLMWRWRRFRGQIGCSYLIGYGILRFSVEFFRGDQDRGAFVGLSTSQWLSLLAIALGVSLWVILRKRSTMDGPASTAT